MTTKLKSQNPPPSAAIPTVKYFVKTYASNISDQKKLADAFKRFESAENLRRLQHELGLLRDGKVTEDSADKIIGKKLTNPSGGYQGWAAKMLLLLSQAKN